jgi:lipopolysaccharide transport system ATP-binding protein
MAEPSIQFEQVWKKFRRGERHDSLKDLAHSATNRLLRRRRDALDAQEFWALSDVSFHVRPGEALGVIGANGAGKSTTLKLLTRIFRATQGRVAVHGRVGALIEVAAGFHPDLTGRENVYLQGAIMGMRRAEIDRKLDDIVDFSGISRFLDTQVKRYSSGMNARLGFSIAAHLDPEVLIIDEVLSVGDTEFQQRCVERMLGFRRAGVPIVFVSHNLVAIQALCSQAVMLERGRLVAAGTPQAVVERYLSSGAADAAPRDGSYVVFQDVKFTADGQPCEGKLRPGARARLVARFQCLRETRDLVATFIVRDARSGTALFAADCTSIGSTRVDGTAGSELLVEVEFTCNLLRGTYLVEMQVYHPETMTHYEQRSPLVVFSVEEAASRSGCVALFPAARVLVGPPLA